MKEWIGPTIIGIVTGAIVSTATFHIAYDTSKRDFTKPCSSRLSCDYKAWCEARNYIWEIYPAENCVRPLTDTDQGAEDFDNFLNAERVKGVIK